MKNFSKTFSYIVVTLLVCLSFLSFGQKEANNWYFGDLAGITFNTTPPSALTNGALTTSEGCATISDANGNLLFYSNGNAVWNKEHQVMDNGLNLLGQSSSTQSALIVKAPGSSTLYYLFTVSEEGGYNYYYCIIDISLNSGLGKVVEKNIRVLKDWNNPSSYFKNTEALTASYHANQTDIWIVMHESGNGNFYSYLLTKDGLQTPVQSTLGTMTFYLGQCRISPNGKKIAVGCYWAEGVEVYDFDNSTGVISNAQKLLGIPYRVYGLSFSPNSNLLYISIDDASIYQFDLTLNNTTDIINSMFKIGEGSGGSYPQLQLGPDNRLYFAQSGEAYLGMIEFPDSLRQASHFVDNAISLGGRTSYLGLPTFMVNYVTTIPEVNLGKDTVLCANQTMVLDAGVFNAIYKWSTGATDKTIEVTKEGTYYVDIVLNGMTNSDTIIVSYTHFNPSGLLSEYNICENEELPLNPNVSGLNYIWDTGESAVPRIVTQPGTYWLDRSIGYCSDKVSFIVKSDCPIFIPNLITTNNDNSNDNFHILNLNVPDWNIKIYNKWGGLVFEQVGYANDWDAREVSDGVYFYELSNRYSNKRCKGWVQKVSGKGYLISE